MTIEQVQRRYLLLTASRWLPTGFLIPLITIAPQQRGLSLAQIGTLVAISAAVVLVLELPTGSLSDVLGRRPVLLAAVGFSLLSSGGVALATSFTAYALAAAAEGVYRALDSGPLDAWYVDAAQAADPDADLETGLAQQGTVLGVAIAAGAVASGGLALLPTPQALPALALPLLVALGLRALNGGLLWTLLREQRPARGSMRVVLADGGRTVREALGLLRTSRPLQGLTSSEVLWGAGMVSVEVFVAPRLVQQLDDPAQAVLVFAAASAVSWAVSGAGAAAAPWLARRTGSWIGAAILTRTVQALAVLGAGLVAGPAGLLAGYLGFYLVHGTANVAHAGLLHRNVTAAHRATTLSMNSLASRLGALIAGPLLGLLADNAGLPAVFIAGAVLLAAGAPLYLLARPARQDTITH